MLQDGLIKRGRPKRDKTTNCQIYTLVHNTILTKKKNFFFSSKFYYVQESFYNFCLDL